ncbi:MAG: hypothetical protein JW955_04945 [Sedimentisphaerales bacterium]|nr:hypothetical protein [Sedimentisphaerales bacterium]
MSEEKTKPIASRRFDRVQVAIWRFPRPNGGSRLSVSFSRSYLDKNDQWQDSGYFDERDLPHIQRGLGWALEEMPRFDDSFPPEA